MSNEDIIAEFKRRYEIIKSKNFIKSHRSNDTGIGKTFEDEMGVTENNSPDVDFMGLIEIKTGREASGSMLTLFTKSPDAPRGAMKALNKKYGVPNAIFPNINDLHTTLSGDKYNTFDNSKYGFKLLCDDANKEIIISVIDNRTKETIEDNISYKYDTIKRIIEHKCSLIAFVDTDAKIINGIEYFHFTHVRFLLIKSFNAFLEGIKKGYVKYDIRTGPTMSGKKIGKYHDHGAAFRISKENFHEIFDVVDLT